MKKALLLAKDFSQLGTCAMTLLDALEVLKGSNSSTARTQETSLACGFTPLHLKTFLAAHLCLRFPGSRAEIRTCLYGDLAGNLERLQPSNDCAVCVVLEWTDLDPRLGLRSLGSWRSVDIPDIVGSARRQSERIISIVKQLAERVRIYLSTPTLPLPPIFHSRGVQAHRYECELREIVANVASRLSMDPKIRIVSAERLGELSPPGQRFDPKAEISTGFPYTLEHASALAESLAILILDAPPKKGLITDLDDTLWSGILGDVGVEGVEWDTSPNSHAHGLYQRFLASLASAGVLLGVASKNELALVQQALARKDILLSKDMLFPLEINWGPKSRSVEQILKKWNIAADDVVFVDDTAMEVAEVQSAFPQMECLLFPKNDLSGVWELLRGLRDRFGKHSLTAEDDFRLLSIRTNAKCENFLHAGGAAAEHFLRDALPKVAFSFGPDPLDARAFELLNKTNQFNLNGRRLSEPQWRSFFQNSNAFLLTAKYGDRYGPLGKIAVIIGRTDITRLYINFWVMSCRAFSRRIEHQCLKYLYEKTGADEIIFEFESTPRNGPIQAFFEEFLGEAPRSTFSLSKRMFYARMPALFHAVFEGLDV